MNAKSLKWSQVNAWRLRQHCLSPRLNRQDAIQAATCTGGIQAQVMSAAELAICTRVEGVGARDVQSALWQDRTLVKTWAMRATLHLIASYDFPLYIAARSLSFESRDWLRYFNYFGISETQFEAYLAAAPQVLSSRPVTRAALATALADHTGIPELRDLMISKGWGTPLKPLAWRGDLCFGPNEGQNVTFVKPGEWIGRWQPVEPYAALQEVARRYLRAYGPATADDFAQWWGIRLIPARKLFRSLEAELEPVAVEGWPAFALSENLESIENCAESSSVILLPLFDAYVMGIGRGPEIEPLLPKAYQKLVYRPQGWISAVVLDGGLMKGIWEVQNRAAQAIVKIHMFSPITAAIQRGIEAEAERLGAFLNKTVWVEY
jgi:hypothetical protein